jgi:hypothetical protein
MARGRHRPLEAGPPQSSLEEHKAILLIEMRGALLTAVKVEVAEHQWVENELDQNLFRSKIKTINSHED